MAEGATGEARPDAPPQPPSWLLPARNWVLRRPAGRLIWRVGIALLGGLIVAGGLLLIPLPGPGWLIVFFGLAVWATEFTWAQRLLRFGRRGFTKWTLWATRQPLWIRGLLGLAGLALLAGLAWFGWRLVR